MTDFSQTFAENEILLTGANGFVGKVILALLLDRYPQAQRVHVLVRPRGGASAAERFRTDVLDSPPLRPLIEKAGREAVERRIQVYEGDASQPLAGLDESACGALAGRVKLILNCAGLVEFFPPVDRSLDANVTAVERLLETARRLGAKLLHVSTCYVAGKADGLIEETEPILGFYPRRRDAADDAFDARRELAQCRAAAERAADGPAGRRRSEALIELGRVRSSRWGWVNTYTYAKSLGEQALAAQTDVEYAIVRPAIVESALRYPFPGWIEGGRTAAPLVLMALGGLLDWPVRPDLSLEVVPVDMVAAATLAVAALLLAGRQRSVYQLGASDVNPYPMEELVRLLAAEAESNGNRAAAAPFWLDPFRRLRFLEPMQAEKRRRTLRRRIERCRGALESLGLKSRAAALRALDLQTTFRERTLAEYLPFIFDNRYVFEAHNIREAYAELSADDREKLPWEPEAIDWPAYWRACQIAGIEKWVQPEAVRKWAFQL